MRTKLFVEIDVEHEHDVTRDGLEKWVRFHFVGATALGDAKRVDLIMAVPESGPAKRSFVYGGGR